MNFIGSFKIYLKSSILNIVADLFRHLRCEEQWYMLRCLVVAALSPSPCSCMRRRGGGCVRWPAAASASPASVSTGLGHSPARTQMTMPVTMIACGIADYGLVQVDATEYLHVISFVFFCSCFYVAKILTLLHCIMIYYSQYRAFTKLMFRCSDAVLHPGSWQPTPIITTSSPPSWPQLPAWLGLGLGPARPGGVNSSKTKPEDVSLNPHSWIWQQ